MSSMPKQAVKAAKPGQAERAAVRELVKAARARGEDLTGPEGLLKWLFTIEGVAPAGASVPG
jgi:putative transposase